MSFKYLQFQRDPYVIGKGVDNFAPMQSIWF